MVKILFVSGTSACLEFDNDEPYYAEKEYEITLNGKPYGKRTENVFSVFGLQPDTQYEIEAAGCRAILRTPSETACLDVKKNGALGDGEADDTYALQACIDACPANGRVLLPAGTYRSAPLKLKSNITLELAKGATLLGVTEPSAYPAYPSEITDESGKERVLTTWEGQAIPSRLSLLYGFDLENVQIVGEGVIDGNAQNSTWWTEEYKQRVIGRPRLVFLNGCKHVTLHGVTAQNSPSWTLHPFFCEDVNFYDVTVFSPARKAPNTDGLDPEGCDGVNVIGCRFSTGDDCIAIKANKIDLAKKYKRAAARHTVRNCYMRHGHGAVVLGSEIGGGVKELSVSKCFFENTERGLRIKTRRGRGKLCVIDGVAFENIKMDGVGIPFVINMYYNCDPDGHDEYVWSREKHPVGDDTPYIGSVAFKNIECKNTNAVAGYFDGLVEQPIRSVRLENVTVNYAADATAQRPDCMDNVPAMCRAGLYFDNVQNIELVNVRIDGADGDTVILKNHETFTEK